MTLYSYWRSSTAYRVRIALNLKGLDHDIQPVDLLGGAQTHEAHQTLNPMAAVPTLVLDDGETLTQSMAMLEFLDDLYPEPGLVPKDPVQAARVRAAAQVIASDIHPVNNLRIIAKLRRMGHTSDQITEWMNDWMSRGLGAFAALLPDGTAFCFDDTPTLADLCLIPQLYNAHRWGTDLRGLERLLDIETRCLRLPAFAAAHPDAQPDANERC